MKNTITITLLLCICFSGCEKNVEEDHVDCSAVETYYTENVAPILSSNCIGCHSASADLPLDSYTSVYSAIKSGNVLDRVNRSSDDNLLMPQYGQKLSTANLDILQNFFDMECSE
ncbi:MAG: hypothetical protein QF616_08290 [Candidatus Marinimicrobia bacterium]|nr:hypothetical protein [Candidatus Neomarinimicrobiota bacterium]